MPLRASYHSRNHYKPASRPSFHGGGGRKGPAKQFIHPSKFIQAAKLTSVTEDYVPSHSFADFEVAQLLKDNVAAKGYVSPSPIQDQAIPHGIDGRDVIGIANTGTGKTAAFALPILDKLLRDRTARALIIAPTRELAQQIEVECRSFARGSGLFGALLIGGMSMSAQIRDLRRDPQIIIGTPGRMKDHTERRTLSLDRFTMVVLDEVDRMVDMGFINDIRYLLGGLPADRQSFFFSATVDQKIEGLMRSFLRDPVTVSVKTGITSDSVEQNVVTYQTSGQKIDKLHDILIGEAAAKVLIFDDTRRAVERLSNDLNSRGFKVDDIHGGKSQGQRKRALDSFRDSRVNVLVATDVAARGIDISDITHVINYSTPNTYDDYIHRIGRAGRAGRVGHALTFIEQ